MGALPSGFEDLEEFVAQWDAETSQDRWVRRSGTDYGEVRRFYDAMVPRMEAATQHVERYPLDAMPEDAACLFRLVLAQMHVAIAVELHQASRVPFSPFPHSLRIERGIQPNG